MMQTWLKSNGWMGLGALVVAILLPQAILAAPLTGAFTYQGRVTKGGSPITGTCDLQFSIWDASGSGNPPSGGSQVGSTQTITGVAVTNGLFSVKLNANKELGATILNNSQRRWIQIAVRNPAGSGSYTILAPRQELTATPYALGLIGGAVIRNDGPAGATASGLYVESLNGDGLTATANLRSKGGLLASHKNGGNGLIGMTSSHATSGTAGVVGANGDAGAGVLGTSEKGAGVEGVANGTASGYGVYGHSTNQTGVWGDSLNSVGVSGTSKNQHGVSGTSLNGSGVQGNSSNGAGVKGTSTNGSGVVGLGPATGGGVQGAAGTPSAVPGVPTAGIGVQGDSSAGPGVLGTSSAGPGAYGKATGTNQAGVLGVATNGPGVFALSGGTIGLLVAGGSINAIEARSGGNPDDANAGTRVFRVTNNGRIFGTQLTIQWTADLAEYIQSKQDKPQPGDVVEIDPNQADNYRLATTANSTRVAGVISTAPAMTLGASEEEADKDKAQLALAGRVPVKVCNQGGPIRPGDLLVSSALAGHAMRAPDAPGAGTVIGKALGFLDGATTGTINMLVMLR